MAKHPISLPYSSASLLPARAWAWAWAGVQMGATHPPALPKPAVPTLTCTWTALSGLCDDSHGTGSQGPSLRPFSRCPPWLPGEHGSKLGCGNQAPFSIPVPAGGREPWPWAPHLQLPAWGPRCPEAQELDQLGDVGGSGGSVHPGPLNLPVGSTPIPGRPSWAALSWARRPGPGPAPPGDGGHPMWRPHQARGRLGAHGVA